MEPMNPQSVVTITFANPIKGVEEKRRIYPYGVRFGLLSVACFKAKDLNRPDEWLLDAADLDRPNYATRSFPLSCIVKWEATPQGDI